MSDDQIDLNKAADNRNLDKTASERVPRRQFCRCGNCGSGKMMDKTPEKVPLENPMDKVAEDLFDK